MGAARRGRCTRGPHASISRTVDGARLHRQSDALPPDIDVLYAHPDDVARLNNLARIFHEAVRELRDMHEPVLVHADVDERAERRDVRYDAFELHAGL